MIGLRRGRIRRSHLAILCLDKIANRCAGDFVFGLHRNSRLGAFATTFHGNESIVISWYRETEDDDNHSEICQDEAGNHHGIVSQAVEFGIGKGEDDRKYGSTDVSEKEGKECRDLPVLSLSYDDVEVAAKLVALFYALVYGVNKGTSKLTE
jgi:hypothetical protein